MVLVIEKMAHNIVEWMIKTKTIRYQEKNVYQYGMEILISTIVNGVILLLLGYLFGKFVQTVVFIGVFIWVKKYIGGYHAPTYRKCILSFSFIYLIVLVGQKIFDIEQIGINIKILWVITTIIVYKITPVIDKNNEIEEDMLPLIRKKGLLNYFFASIILIGLYKICGDPNQIILFGVLALIVTGGVGIAGNIANKRKST